MIQISYQGNTGLTFMICILVINFISLEHILARNLHKTFHNGIQNMFTD